ncbi:hypothetical protein GDO81_030106, partial [Engystomops pustulosus]
RKLQPGKQIKFKRLESFVRDSRRKLRDDCRIRRMKIYRKKIPNISNEKLAFVVRITDIRGVNRPVMKILKFFRLTKIFSGVFLKLTPETLQMIQVIEPYVAWGIPNLKSVRELILKRGEAVVNGKKKPLTDNMMIEEHLGNRWIDSPGDIIHELQSTGDHSYRQ